MDGFENSGRGVRVAFHADELCEQGGGFVVVAVVRYEGYFCVGGVGLCNGENPGEDLVVEVGWVGVA